MRLLCWITPPAASQGVAASDVAALAHAKQQSNSFLHAGSQVATQTPLNMVARQAWSYSVDTGSRFTAASACASQLSGLRRPACWPSGLYVGCFAYVVPLCGRVSGSAEADGACSLGRGIRVIFFKATWGVISECFFILFKATASIPVRLAAGHASSCRVMWLSRRYASATGSASTTWSKAWRLREIAGAGRAGDALVLCDQQRVA